MRELAVQAANGSNSSSDTSLLNQEFNQLQTEVNRIQQSTTFNGVNVFQNRDTVFQIGFGTSSNDRVNMVSNALVSSQALGTTTITDSSANVSYLDIGSAVSIANTYATGGSVTGTANQIAYIYNATVDAVNSNQKLSFTAKNDILNTLSAINSAYNSSGVTGVSTANFVLDTAKVVGSVAAGSGTPTTSGSKTLQITLSAAAPTGASTTFAADSFGTNPVTQAASSNVLSINVNAASVGTTSTAGTLLYTGNTLTNGQTNALAAISSIDNALTEANNASAIQGAIQNRFSAVISNLSAFSLSQSAAKSRIVDADFAAETSKLAKNQILQQAGTAMLAQANQSPSFVLTLLK
jgi:flagellin